MIYKNLVFLLLILGLALADVPADGAKPVLTDKAIGDKVQDELEADPGVQATRVNIVVNRGVVTLTGEVDNLLARERAAAVAETVKGVRAVVNTMKVVPPFLLRDWEIKEIVEDALLEDPATDSYEVRVTVSGNVVTLTGTVDSWQEKHLAEKVSKGVKGVTEVNNQLAVRYDETRPDIEIKADVEQILKWDALVDHEMIRVEVKEASVKLSGTVGSAAEKSRAVLGAHVTGVKSVDSTELEVEGWARDERMRKTKYVHKSDEDIRKAVADALRLDPRVRYFNVYPEVSSGYVTLRGEVSNVRAKSAAEQDAWHTVGVKYVQNRLKVRPLTQVSDPKIEERVRKALLRDPYVEKSEITVQVFNGIVKLYGTVDSSFEKRRAEEAASRVKGVVGITNNLLVSREYEIPVTDPYLDPWERDGARPYTYHPPYPLTRDEQIKKDIEDELWWSPFVDLSDISVSVDNGVATLTGTVQSWSEYRAARENAYEGGAIFVHNRLRVETSDQ
jgi:osmotically-inducible protein OsmY